MEEETPREKNTCTAIELSFLLAIIFLALYLGYGNAAGHAIAHDFPVAYLASDAFQHQTRAQGLLDAGNYRYEAFYNMRGYPDVVGFYMPVMYHLTAQISLLSGLASYDAIQLMVFFTVIPIIALAYFMVRGFNRNAALIGLGFVPLIFSQGSYSGFLWGHWPSLLSQAFLVCALWSFLNIHEEGMTLLAGLFFAASVLTHTSEAIFLALFIFIYALVLFLKKEMGIAMIKKFAGAFALTAAITIYFMVIFKTAWFDTQGSSYMSLRPEPVWLGGPTFYLQYFGLFIPFLIMGIVAAVLFWKKKNAKFLYPSLFLLAAGCTNYIGFGMRAFTLRFNWPVYLGGLLGLGLYLTAKAAYRKWDIKHSMALAIAILIPVTGLVSIPYVASYQQVSGSITDPYHWQAYEWIAENTPKDAAIYFLYSEHYEQDAVMRNSRRFHALATLDSVRSAMNDMALRRTLHTEVPGDTGGGLIQRTGFMHYATREDNRSNMIDVCTFDYIVVDIVTRSDALTAYNRLFLQQLLKNENNKIVLQNEVLAIVQNTNKSVACMPDEVEIENG